MEQLALHLILSYLILPHLTLPCLILSYSCSSSFILIPLSYFQSLIIIMSLLYRFSNRVFIDKAIAGWTGKSDLDHIQTVGDYLHHSSEGWETPYKAVDLSPSDRTDPLYAVVAVKR